MMFTLWAVVIGVLLTTMALSASLVKRLPLSTSMLYLAVGYAIGPAGWGMLLPDPLAHAGVLERATEIALLISLFAAGLALGVPFSNRRWHLPLRLAVVSMLVTIALLVPIGIWGLQLPLGAAILLAAILAPTDPVLASDVQVETATDADRLRFSLTGEGGLNDGIAFPFVLLGLGLLGVQEWQGLGRWLAVDVLWGLMAGLAIGVALGTLLGKLALYLRTERKSALGMDDFLVLGLIALSYGIALLCHASGFLAVFAAGLALRRTEQSGGHSDQTITDSVVMSSEKTQAALATDPDLAGAYMMRAVSGFNEHMERIGEVAVVLLVGAMLALTYWPDAAFWFIPLLLVVIRPFAVAIGLWRANVTRDQRVLISWFGIRGIGSIYYVLFAINRGLPPILAAQLLAFTISTVVVSILLHGISVTPLMTLYARNKRKQKNKRTE
jgi:NhaP-type Na+/H+ or K+/H+ antiporter